MFLLHTKIMEHSSSYILVLSPNDAFLKIRQKRVQRHCISTSTRSSLNNVPNIMYVYYFEFSVSERKAHTGTFSFIRRFIRLGKKNNQSQRNILLTEWHSFKFWSRYPAGLNQPLRELSFSLLQLLKQDRAEEGSCQSQLLMPELYLSMLWTQSNEHLKPNGQKLQSDPAF